MLRFAALAFAALLALALPAAAQEKPTLTVYTYDSFVAEWGPGPALKTGFEAVCGCTIDYVATQDGIAALRRVQLEGPATKADIVLGLDSFISGDARATGLFAPHGLDLTTLAFATPWTDPDFVPFDHGYFAFVYKTAEVATPPTSFEALIALPPDFKIVVMDPRSSTPGLGLILWIKQAYGDRAAEIWAGLKPHILTMSKGWSEGYDLFLKGEADMALSYTTSPAFHAVYENDPGFAAAPFDEGHIQQVEVSGILKSSPNQQLARDFLAYMLSPEGQKTLPTTNWMYPVIDLGADLPAAFGPQPAKILPVDEAAVTANRSAWIEEAFAAIRWPRSPRRPLRLIGGAALAVAVTVLIVTLFWSILAAASGQATGAGTTDIGYLIYITTLQATLSTILSLLAGIALAWALNRLRFPGRGLVIGLFAAAIVTPGLVVAFGLLAVWGRSGWLGSLGVPIFGLGGVIAAHIILDGAFAARILLARLDAIPDTRLKTGQSLALSAATRFAIIDWPAMRGTLPGLAAIIFLLAFTSFPVVLLLGGGPSVQTLEVAIYSAVKFDFDLALAVRLALIQIAICSVIILASAAFAPISSSLDRPATPRWRDRKAARGLQWLVLAIALVGFASPLLAVLWNGLVGLGDVLARPAFWNAVATSLGIGAASAILALLLALTIASARAATLSRAARTAIGAPAYAYLAVPAVALALGAFLSVRALGLATELAAPFVVILANALLALPFAMATLAPPFDAIASSRGKLIRALGLSGRRQFLEVEWPLIARDAGLVLAIAFCFSLGDLGVIALFGTQDFVTLPLLMVRALGAYRTHDAGTIAALMLVLTIAAFTGLPALFERLSHARA